MPRTEKEIQQIRDERKEQILHAAKVFARNGYVGTRIDDIAAAAAVSKGLIYHYFDSKDVTFVTLIERSARGALRLLAESAEQPGGTADRLRWLIQQELDGSALSVHGGHPSVGE
ncbi:hypothetical protein GCM10025857_16260 [Alicyclobacillus contaminans]|uniref:TetR/AcrR family transcriptional regulator n=1 Tax=Alicyclobacillus contaminans TaxID=392016 RepID=UPI0004252379|nr:TetR/AcrR family transcriptional regulator [Alicyclobacillus contaminans]GMA50269.1 hypothetical protein GCM10025857_16260 [Alicyclobacillus contaminans]